MQDITSIFLVIIVVCFGLLTARAFRIPDNTSLVASIIGLILSIFLLLA